MTGPLAPMDPQEKRQGFYVLLDKEVGGLPPENGTVRHPIHLDGDRLVTFAKIVGGVTDEAILDKLTTVQGFRDLVHSIGITVTTADPAATVGFCFLCYTADGPCGGSDHGFRLTGDGVERVIPLDTLTWPERDAVPGQFLFLLAPEVDTATVTLKLYLNDGYTVPEVDPDPPVDLESQDYRDLVARSFLSGGNNHRLKAVLRKARAGEDVTVAFLGGSITQGAGAVPTQERCYARETFRRMQKRYGAGDGSHLHYIKAGVGGTPSETALLRYDRDITRNGTVQPDLVVVEFAVNDASDETEGVCYESLVKKILSQPNHPAVILLFAVFANDWNLKERLAPIGWRYQLPMVDLLEAVSPQFSKNSDRHRVMTKRQYFYDVYHPSNLGHRLMSDCLLYLIDRLDHQQEMAEPLPEIPPYYGVEYADVHLLDRKDNCAGADIRPGSFTGRDTDLQAVPLDDDLENTPQFPYNWQKAEGNDPFVLELTCSALLLEFKDSADPQFGRVEVWVDGAQCKVLDPREAGWTHCHTTILFHEPTPRRHRVAIFMTEKDREKTFTILGFGYVISA
ncbi:MAG: SGNH/GDSL hydrolase family protein [Clostridiales bacterium]|nr:SGNH/GDSL hydrolase family protein [Clostridiales bacterium]